MKTDEVRAFRRKVIEDGSLRKALAKLDSRDIAGVTEVARGAGFDISAEEYRAVADATGTDWKRWIASDHASSGQMSEADLASVAGGMRPVMLRSAGSSSPPTDDDLYCC
jgi:predicted ribosomally synthesized peptide with nif11-like leader